MTVKRVRIEVVKNKMEVASSCGVAESFGTRFMGYMGHKDIPAGEALLFPDCKSVHMWFMALPLDIVFLTTIAKAVRVTSVHSRVKPWRLLPVSDFHADTVLELPAGSADRCELKIGDELCISSR